MTKCPHCSGDHTLSQCPTWRVPAAEQALITAALNLAAVSRAGAALLPVPNTTPQLLVGLGEVEQLARLLGYHAAPGYRLVSESLTPAVEEALRRHTPMPQTAWAECMAAVERVTFLAGEQAICPVCAQGYMAARCDECGVTREIAQSQASAAPVLTDADIERLWDAQRKYHGGEPCKVGHAEFARAIERHLAATPAKTEGM